MMSIGRAMRILRLIAFFNALPKSFNATQASTNGGEGVCYAPRPSTIRGGPRCTPRLFPAAVDDDG